MSQLSFFSAESVPPAVADLTGVLAAAGQVVMVGGGARLSVVVEELWRARALAEMMTEAGEDAALEDWTSYQALPIGRALSLDLPGNYVLAAIFRPSMADKTEMAGVMAPSP